MEEFRVNECAIFNVLNTLKLPYVVENKSDLSHLVLRLPFTTKEEAEDFKNEIARATSTCWVLYSDNRKKSKNVKKKLILCLREDWNILHLYSHEEEEYINQFFARMEKRLSEPDVSSAEVEEMVKICMVCETMGYKADFIYVHSLKLAQKGNFQQKHTGYLAAEFFLHPNHELVILLINTIQKDLNSSNHLEVRLALTVVCQLISSETVHNVLHLVEDKLNHTMPSVRKSAVLALMHCLQLADSESAYQMAFPKLEKCLSDSELEVVSVVVPTLHKVIKNLSCDFSYLLDSLLQLLEQILMRRIPHSMNYSDIPAPWLQIDILKLLKDLCKTSECSEKLMPVLKKTLAQTGLYHTIAQAIVYQVLETIACIEADAEILESAMSSVSLLLKSRDVNMKFMGLEALVLIVKKIEPNITATQQEIIIDCLKLPDETLQLKTLELMYHLANSANVQAICKKMTEFLDQTKEKQKKKDLAEKILSLAEKYANRSQWYISVAHAVLLKVDDLMTSTDICKIVNVILLDEELKKIAKQDFTKHLEEKGSVPSSWVKIHVSLLSMPVEFTTLFPLLETAGEESASWILISLMESILKYKSVPANCADTLKKLEKNFEESYSLQIILKQLLQIIHHIGDIRVMDPNTKVDPSLTFLDNYVLQSLENSEDLYEPPSLRMTAISADRSITDFTSNSFCIVNPETVSQTCDSSFTMKSPAYSTFSSPSISFQSLSSEMDLSSPTFKKKGVWTKEGRSKVTQESSSSVKETSKDDEELLELFAGVT